jgi:ParB family transcriptional regulator, chromosome partitioning protein
MSKENDLLNRFGANLAESMGANRASKVVAPTVAKPDRADGTDRLRSAVEIEVDRVVPDPNQPRTEFDPEAIARLADSLKEHGQLQPISVRWSEEMGRYLVVTGERRWRASVMAGRRTIAAIMIEDDKTDSQILEMQLIENCLREDLQPIEQARAFRTLLDRNGWSAVRLAKALSLNNSTIIRALSLLDLPEAVQSRVEAGELAPSVAYEVSKLDDPIAQAEVAARVVAEGLSRAETVEAVKRAASRPRAGGGKAKGRGTSPRKLTERVFKTEGGTRVTLENRRGLDAPTIRAALAELLAKIDAELGDDQVAA